MNSSSRLRRSSSDRLSPAASRAVLSLRQPGPPDRALSASPTSKCSKITSNSYTTRKQIQDVYSTSGERPEHSEGCFEALRIDEREPKRSSRKLPSLMNSWGTASWEQVTHAVDKDSLRSAPSKWQGELVWLESQLESVPISRISHGFEPDGKSLCIAVLTARAYLGATRNGVPSRVRPLDPSRVGHRGDLENYSTSIRRSSRCL
jgi:hypothetical protein